MASPGQGHDRAMEEVDASSSPARAVAALAGLGGALSALLIVVMLGLVTYAVVQRYVVGRPLVWSDAMAGYLLVALMLGAAEALRRGDHISIDLLTTRCGPRGRQVIAIFSDLTVVLFALLVGWSAWGQISFAYDFGSFTADHLEIPSWIPMVPLLAACVLLALTALARLIGTFAQGAQR